MRLRERRAYRWALRAFLAVVWGSGLAGVGLVTQPLSLRRVHCPHREADEQRLRDEVLALTALPRDASAPENLGRVALHLQQALARAGARDVQVQPFTAWGASYRNVIARFGPGEGARIVVGAHYDAYGPFPGADDDASGVAVLLELAHTFAEQPPPAPVVLVAYTLEEPPAFASARMGSAVHARSQAEAGVPIRAMLALECVGFFSDEPHSQSFPFPALGLLYPDRGDFIAVVGDLSGGELARTVRAAMRASSPLPVESINAPRSLPGIDFSDHRSYWDQGYAAAMITDTAFYRNERYHSARDTAETLDYRRLKQVVEGTACAVDELARGK